MEKATFGGDKKVGQSILWATEQKMIQWCVPKIPSFITPDHLTFATIPISALIILFSYFGRSSFEWLWLVSLMIAFQYFSDSFDGALGRYRNSGMIKWGYYMDHFLDYVFLCSILIGYSLMLPDNFKYLQFFILVICGAFMVNSYLAFAATNHFRISYLGIGPTEIRIVFIVVNTLLILFGKTHMVTALPFALLFSFFGLCVVVYRTQKEIRQIDVDAKKNMGVQG